MGGSFCVKRALSGMLYCGRFRGPQQFPPLLYACRFWRKPKCQPLEFLGKNTLPVYMLHQPVLMAIFTLIDLIGVL